MWPIQQHPRVHAKYLMLAYQLRKWWYEIGFSNLIYRRKSSILLTENLSIFMFFNFCKYLYWFFDFSNFAKKNYIF